MWAIAVDDLGAVCLSHGLAVHKQQNWSTSGLDAPVDPETLY